MYYLSSAVYILFRVSNSKAPCTFYPHVVSTEGMHVIVSSEFDLVHLICMTHLTCTA